MPPGSILGLSAPMVPIMEAVPNVIHQSYYWSRISTLLALIPERFHGSNYDRSPWLGYEFELDTPVAMRRLGLTEDEARQCGGEPKRLNEDEPIRGRDDAVVYGYCISYQAHLVRQDVKHPEERWRLILLKGLDRVIVHDRPYQQYSADQKTLIGLHGHFIHIHTSRYVSDSAFPPSDVAMTRGLVDELSRGRSQMVQQRDRSRPMRQINISQVDPDQAEKIKLGQYQELIFSNSNEPIVQEVARAQFPRENFEFNRTIKADISEAWALGNVQRGVGEDTRKTATELSIQQGNSDTRLERERNRLAKWYSRGAEKLAGLLQLFEDTRTEVQILGEDGVERLVPWDRKALPARIVCTAKPDTMVRQDAAGEFKRALDLYQMTANDPNVNRVELLTALLRKANQDPTQIVVRELPEKKPEPPKIAISVKGEDLNPSMPQFPMVQQMLQEGGVTISPENIALGLQLAQKQQAMGAPVHGSGGPVAGPPRSQTEHGGATQPQEPLSKHTADLTGRLDGEGAAHAGSVS
jgi:hypothetical protein